MKFSKHQLTIIYTLSLLTALEALSIDLYLPAFFTMAKDYHVNVEEIQISLSVFIGGFAVGQLLWGGISDNFGRKKPLLLAMLIFTISSFAIIFTTNISQLWFWRFIQAFSGSAGVVISRAIVKDEFDNKSTIKVFTILNILMGIVPVIAPIIGNLLLKIGHWHLIFIMIGLVGVIALVMVSSFLKIKSKTFKEEITSDVYYIDSVSSVPNFKYIFHDRQFVIYTVIGSLSYSGLMIYISGSPFLIMIKGGFSETQYSYLFALNSVGIIGASYLINHFIRFFKLKSIVKFTAILQTFFALLIIFMIYMNYNIYGILVLLFLYLMGIGIFLPSTMELALQHHKKKSGRASSLFGFIQLGIAFLFSTIMGFMQKGSEISLIAGLFICAILSMFMTIIDGTRRR